MENTSQLPPRELATGWTLILPALLATAVMFHHPADAHSGLAQPIHAAMMSFGLLTTFGFWRLFGRSGSRSAELGLLLYVLGVAASMVAATMDGFVVPSMAVAGSGTETLRLGEAMVRAFASDGAVAISLAYLCWAPVLLAKRRKLLAASAVAAGIIPLIALLSGMLTMDRHGAMAVYAIQFLWAAAVGVAVCRSSAEA